MPEHEVFAPFSGSAIPHVGTYRRVLPVSLERMYENTLDWAHLPYLHASSFRSIECEDAGSWGWRARVIDNKERASVIELRLDKSLRRWITRNLEGPSQGAEIWTHAFAVDAHRVDINVDFFVPEVAHDAREKVGRAYADAYATLYDEDVAMMVERQRQIDRRLIATDATVVDVGDESALTVELAAANPVEVDYRGRRYCLTAIDSRWFVYPSVCPHQLGPLRSSEVVEGVVRCPWHGYAFDVVSGEGVNGHACRLDNRPTATVEAGRVVLRASRR